jgi:Na+-driven multidrug efflux pump
MHFDPMDTAQDIQKRMTIRALTGPIFIETFLRMLFLNIDVYMLQFFSGKAVAAMGPIMQLYFCMVIVMMVSTSGAGILIAQNLGAKRYGVAAEYSLASLMLVFISGIVVGIVVHMNSRSFWVFLDWKRRCTPMPNSTCW